MRKFFINLVCFSILPFFIIGTFIYFYIKRDVYQDFGTHKNYSWKYYYQPLGDVSTKKLLNSSIQYNSFIFGSSRTCSLHACYLQKKISNSSFFHYANWNETVGGVYAKMNLLDSLGYRMDNVFIFFDTDGTFANDGKCHDDYYLLTNESRFDYYFNHLKDFIPPNLDSTKFKLLFFNEVNKEAFPNWESDIRTNDSNHNCSDSTISSYGYQEFGKNYIDKIDSLKRTGFLYSRSKKELFIEKQISPYEYTMMFKICNLLKKHKSHYYIVITPLYDQLKFDAMDMQLIKNVFGDNVYDFSGINRITDNECNYPDKKHFLPYVSKTIVDSIINSRQ